MSKRFVYEHDNGFMHESAKRLLDCARAATKDRSDPITDFAGLGRRLDVTSAVMSNWKRRGVSKEGAIRAEKEFGCTVQWILEGSGTVSARSPAPPPGDAMPVMQGNDRRIQLVKMFDVLPDAEQAEVFDALQRRAARVLGDRLLSERFGVTGYAGNRQVEKAFGTVPTPAPGDRRDPERHEDTRERRRATDES